MPGLDPVTVNIDHLDPVNPIRFICQGHGPSHRNNKISWPVYHGADDQMS